MAKYKFSDIAINSTAKKKPEESDKNVYIGLEHLDSQCLQVNRFGSEVAPIGEKLLMNKGDVLFGKRRAYQKKVAIAPFDGIFSAHGMVLRPKEAVIVKEYFPFFISSDYFLENAIKISVGSLSPTINWGDLKNSEFYLPTLEEQKKIAIILWSSEKLKQKYEKSKILLEEVKNKTFEIFLCEMKKRDNIKEKTLNDIVIKTVKSNFPASAGLDQGHYPFFLSGKMIKSINQFIVDGESILCNDGGSAMFRFNIGKCSYSDHVFGIKVKGNELEIKYLFYYLDYFKSYIDENLFKGTGLKNIDKKGFFKLLIAIPKSEDQIKLINKMENMDSELELLERQIQTIKLFQTNVINGGQVNV